MTNLQPASSNLIVQNDICPETPNSFFVVHCHACRLSCKYPSNNPFKIYTSNSGSCTRALLDLSVLPKKCPGCNHNWNTSISDLLPNQHYPDCCVLCHVEFYMPASMCWACGFGFTEVWEGLGCCACEMMSDSSCALVWVRRDVEHTQEVVSQAYVNLWHDGRMEYLDEVEDVIVARRREVEKRKRGVRCHLQV